MYSAASDARHGIGCILAVTALPEGMICHMGYMLSPQNQCALHGLVLSAYMAAGRLASQSTGCTPRHGNGPQLHRHHRRGHERMRPRL